MATIVDRYIEALCLYECMRTKHRGLWVCTYTGGCTVKFARSIQLSGFSSLRRRRRTRRGYRPETFEPGQSFIPAPVEHRRDRVLTPGRFKFSKRRAKTSTGIAMVPRPSGRSDSVFALDSIRPGTSRENVRDLVGGPISGRNEDAECDSVKRREEERSGGKVGR